VSQLSSAFAWAWPCHGLVTLAARCPVRTLKLSRVSDFFAFTKSRVLASILLLIPLLSQVACLRQPGFGVGSQCGLGGVGDMGRRPTKVSLTKPHLVIRASP
jgi:hypothetical protein